MRTGDILYIDCYLSVATNEIVTHWHHASHTACRSDRDFCTLEECCQI